MVAQVDYRIVTSSRMDPNSYSAVNFRYVPILGSPKKVWQQLSLDGSATYYWWAVEWDLPNISQHAGRRQERWENLFAKAGWDTECVSAMFKPSNLTALRRPAGEQQEFAEEHLFFEQAVSTEGLVFLLLIASHSKRGKSNNCKAQLSSLAGGDFLQDVQSQSSFQGEICIGTASCSAACPFSNGQLHIAVIKALASRGHKCMINLWSKLKSQTDMEFCNLADAFCSSCELNMSQVCCRSFAALIGKHLLQYWAELSADPLFSRVRPRLAKKCHARYDPDLKNAIADALQGGPSGMHMLNRMAGAFRGTSLLQVKHSPRASHLEAENLCRYLHELKTISSKQICKRIAVCIDGARLGGKKMMCGPLMYLDSQMCAWPLPQIMRDFRCSLTGSLSSSDVEDCLIGLRCFFRTFFQDDGGNNKEQQDGEENIQRTQKTHTTKNTGNTIRIASLDLGYALENWLQSAGMSLSNFTFFPQIRLSIIVDSFLSSSSGNYISGYQMMIKIHMNTSVLLCSSTIICFVELKRSYCCSFFVFRLGPWSSVPQLVICMDRVSRSFAETVFVKCNAISH